jgi:hypothetical protein
LRMISVGRLSIEVMIGSKLHTMTRPVGQPLETITPTADIDRFNCVLFHAVARQFQPYCLSFTRLELSRPHFNPGIQNWNDYTTMHVTLNVTLIPPVTSDLNLQITESCEFVAYLVTDSVSNLHSELCDRRERDVNQEIFLKDGTTEARKPLSVSYWLCIWMLIVPVSHSSHLFTHFTDLRRPLSSNAICRPFITLAHNSPTTCGYLPTFISSAMR